MQYTTKHELMDALMNLGAVLDVIDNGDSDFTLVWNPYDDGCWKVQELLIAHRNPGLIKHLSGGSLYDAEDGPSADVYRFYLLKETPSAKVARYKALVDKARHTEEGRKRVYENISYLTELRPGDLLQMEWDTLIELWAMYKVGLISVGQMVNDIAMFHYHQVPGWREQFKAVRDRLYRLREAEDEEYRYSATDIRAFNAPSECMDIVTDRLERQARKVIANVFWQTRMSPVLFWTVIRLHMRTYERHQPPTGWSDACNERLLKTRYEAIHL